MPETAGNITYLRPFVIQIVQVFGKILVLWLNENK